MISAAFLVPSCLEMEIPKIAAKRRKKRKPANRAKDGNSQTIEFTTGLKRRKGRLPRMASAWGV
jgi:hypothetical protein